MARTSNGPKFGSLVYGKLGEFFILAKFLRLDLKEKMIRSQICFRKISRHYDY